MKKLPKRNRIIVVFCLTFGLILLGILYFLLIKNIGFRIPCIFNTLTGFQCPGCGITAMFEHLFCGDVRQAFLDNPLTFCLLPVLLGIYVYLAVFFIKNGHVRTPKAANIFFICILIAYLVFWVFRNI